MTDTPTEREEQGAWAKVRHRKVVQWGLAYAAGAWALLQGLTHVVATFHWPEQVQQVGTLLLPLGLPIVVTLAWYHGDRGQQRFTRSELVVLAALLLLGGTTLWWWGQRAELQADADSVATPAKPMARDQALMDDKSIAVLPFVNMSADPEQDYFSDGISEQVLDLLARIPELRVIARTSSFSFKGKDADITTIAQRLNVSHILEGSVRKSGQRVRITTQLIRAADSSHMWSETYDRELTDIFAVQDEIAAAVVTQLKLRLLGGQLPARSMTHNAEAYALLLEARYLMGTRTAESLQQAHDRLKQALALDPGYADAWAALSSLHTLRAGWVLRNQTEAIREARAAAQRALALDPTNADAQLAIAGILMQYDWDWSGAEAALKKVLETQPGNASALGSAGFLMRILGRNREAIDLYRRSIAVDPMGSSSHRHLSNALLTAGQVAEAERELRTALTLEPEMMGGHYFRGRFLLVTGRFGEALESMQAEETALWRPLGLTLAYHALGRHAESDAALAQLKTTHSDGGAVQIAGAHAYRGETDLAFEWLESAYRQRDAGLMVVKSDVLLEGIRRDLRYVALMKRMNLPES
jgi:TolB-like protein/Tfp pilus assembly protein PilF